MNERESLRLCYNVTMSDLSICLQVQVQDTLVCSQGKLHPLGKILKKNCMSPKIRMATNCMLICTDLSFLLGRICITFPQPHMLQLNDTTAGAASSTIYSRYENFKLLSLFISLETDCFHSQ